MSEERKVLLEVKNLSVEFNGFKALTSVNMKIYDGELRVIIGPNGAGKTTFMDLVTGKSTPTSGKVIFDGRDITGKSTTEITRNYHIGRKFQGPNVFDNMTVKENIEIAAEGFNSLHSCVFFRKTKAWTRCLKKSICTITAISLRVICPTDSVSGWRSAWWWRRIPG